MNKPWSRSAAVLAAFLLLTACSVPTEGSAPEREETPAAQGELYRLYFLENDSVFDQAGRRIPEEEVYTTLSDPAAGEERYRTRTRREDTGEDDEWGNPIVQEYSALYDLEGNLLYDWEPITYASGVGGLLIRQEPRSFYDMPDPASDYESALWDPVTGETVLEDVAALIKMDRDCFLAEDFRGMALGTVNARGEVLSGFPVPEAYYYPSVQGKWILTDLQDPYSGDWDENRSRQCRILDENFNILWEGERLNMASYGLHGPYFLVDGEENRREVRSLEDFSLLCFFDNDLERLEYFDGECLILRTGDRDDGRYVLRNAQGMVLSAEYDELRAENDFSSDFPSERFLGRAGEHIDILDRDGKVLYSTDLPGVEYCEPQGGGYYACCVTCSDPDSGEALSSACLLGPELQMLVSAGTYSYIYRFSTEEDGHIVWQDFFAGRKMVNNSFRTDLLDLSGTVRVSDLTAVDSISNGRMAAVRGFSMGLMDLEGNWISRYSIYDNIEQD